MKTIVLTGMMGSGKTTVGKFLADKLNFEFIDIDKFIEEKENLTISDIFKFKGESYFRQLEKETIQTVFNPRNQVISLGGGAFENRETRDFLLKNSCIIYLKTSPENIFQRIKNNNERPLLCDNMSVEKITEIISKRKTNYETAPNIIITDNKTPDEIIKEITGVLL